MGAMLRVTVLEDEATMRDLLRELLTEEGHQVRAYDHPRQATLQDVDVIITDCFSSSYTQLADTDRAYLRELAAVAPTILYTGRGWAQQAQAEELGLAAILLKPASMDVLLDTVEQAAGRTVRKRESFPA